MKVAFIRPAMFGARSRDAMYPLVFALVKPLVPEGVEIDFYDERVEELPHEPDACAVAMTVETFSAKRSYLLAKSYRQQGKKVILGGYHPTMVPEECAQYADAVVTGEAEDTWRRVLDDLRSGTLKKRYDSKNNADLSALRPDYSAFKGKKYNSVGIVQFSRGCRYSCEFCSVHAFYGSSIRCKPVERLVAELKDLREKYIFFIDDNLFADEMAAREMFTAITPLKKRWACQISLDAARDRELLRLMKKSGCVMVLLGFESLDRDNLKQMAKGANIIELDYEKLIGNIYDAGLMIYGTFVVGYDHDTKATAAKLAQFALKHKFTLANFNPLMPMPGTKLYERLEREKKLAFDRWWLDDGFSYGDAMLQPGGMAREELMGSCRDARYRFNKWPNIIRRLLHRVNCGSFANAALFMALNTISRAEIYAKQGRKLGGEPV